MNKKEIGEIDWGKGGGLIPAIIQDAATGTVLMLGYMNKEALQKTLETEMVWFYSRTKKRLWQKGEESGHILRVVDTKLDCDNDALLVKADPTGPTCHTGSVSCFSDELPADALKELFETIASRKETMPGDSYTASLFKAGLDKISLKVAEESLEVVHAAQKETKERLQEETVDLLYHLFVLLAQKGVTFEEIGKAIQERRKGKA